MTDYVLSIDPGLSTGIALLSYDAETPAQLVQSWQFSGGVMGLKKWIRRHWRESGWNDYQDEPQYGGLRSRAVGVPHFLTDETRYEYVGDTEEDYREVEIPPNLVVITEKFTARNTKGFAYTTASLEALRGEGALIMADLMPDYDVKEKRWRDPNGQYIFGGTDKSTKKKAQHAWLKANGFYVTGKTLEAPNADDFRSAAAHGVGYIVKELKHKPTWDLVRGYSE